VTAAVIAAELFALSCRMKNARAQARRDVALERIDADKRGRA
ncbi:MAG: heme exporter protein CcmD, partial [Methyloversatilis sp.]|nr:heme exporter protein CcmD [Methyloversatilis sp.]